MKRNSNLQNTFRRAFDLAQKDGIAWGVMWNKDKVMWQPYDLRRGTPEGCVPEFICVARGIMPIPLNDTAEDVLQSLMRSLL